MGGEIEPVLTYISMFDILRQNNFEGNFLEIGEDIQLF